MGDSKLITYTWKILGITAESKSVHYSVTASDDTNIVKTEGNHTFSDGVVNMSFEQIKEENLIDWLIKDTTKDDVNDLKLNLENQIQALESNKKVNFPWLADTFTPES